MNNGTMTDMQKLKLFELLEKMARLDDEKRNQFLGYLEGTMSAIKYFQPEDKPKRGRPSKS